MAALGWAIDAYVLDLSLRGRRPATIASYRRLLDDLADLVPDKATQDLTLPDYERFLARWTSASPSTLASSVSLARGFSRFLFERGFADTDAAYPLRRPRRRRAEDIDVVTISTEEAARLLLACEDWQELLCIGAALYLGWRRAALSRARRSSVDLVHGTMRVAEKGGKVLTKPIPDEYLEILRQAEAAGVWAGPDAHLIPNRRPASVGAGERDDKVIWNTVKRVAARAGVTTHVHALRAAFAVQFDEQHPEQVIALKELMGHSRLETTLVYLRRKNKAKAMESVRDLSFGAAGFRPEARNVAISRDKAHTGFEPVFEGSAVPEPIRRKLEELRARSAARSRA
jgi:integrase